MTTTFTIRGDQLVVDPAMSTNSSRGEATLQWGRQMFASDHLIEITATNAESGELTGRSGITGLKVYDATGKLVAEYAPMNPGQTANIQSDISGLGDDYARINTSVMKPVVGSQWIGPILITNGANSFGTYPQTFKVGNGAYDIKAMPSAAPMACFGAGVRLLRPWGDTIAVRDLRAGDLVMTDEGPAETLWTGKRDIICTSPREWPIEVEGELFSPLHRILWQGGWAKAKHLAEGGFASVRRDIDTMEYHHVLLPRHSVVLTAANRVESFLVTPASLALFPEARDQICACAHRSGQLRLAEWRRHDVLQAGWSGVFPAAPAPSKLAVA